MIYLLSFPEFYDENCDCPQTNPTVWNKAMGCPASYTQIDTDLAKFKDIDHEKNANETMQRFGKRYSPVHYSIIENTVCILFNFVFG